MIALATLQHKFQTLVLSGSDSEHIGPAVIATLAADASTRLDIYVHAYRARLAEVLGDDFPGLRALVDADGFQRLCYAYIDATPSTHYNARWYGDRLPAFLRTTQPWSETPALAEMALLEWTMGLSFDAADENYIGADDVAALAPEQWPALRLRLHGAVRRLSLCWNVGAIRRAVDREETSPPITQFDSPQSWVISRQDTVVRHRLVPPDEAAAMDAIESGACFAEVCQAQCERHAEDAVAMRAATMLRQWIQDQWVAELLPVE